MDNELLEVFSKPTDVFVAEAFFFFFFFLRVCDKTLWSSFVADPVVLRVDAAIE